MPFSIQFPPLDMKKAADITNLSALPQDAQKVSAVISTSKMRSLRATFTSTLSFAGESTQLSWQYMLVMSAQHVKLCQNLKMGQLRLLSR